MKIRFWKADDTGCGYYRCELVAAALQDRGHDAAASTVMADDWLDADVIVGQRVCMPAPTQRWQELARRANRPMLVYEIDDDLFDVDPSNKPAWGLFSRPEIGANLRANIAVADAVTCTTIPLAERLLAMNPNVHVVANFIPAWLLDLPEPAHDPRTVTIGWGGGASHAMDWADAAPQVARFIGHHDHAELHVMGWHPPELRRWVFPHQRRHTEWIASVPDYLRAIDFHIGLAPLRAHTFNAAKSHIKALELAALGIPCVASDVGPYPDFIEHGTTGFLIRYPHAWPRYLRELLDPGLRAKFGAAARAKAAKHTIESNIELWEKALT